MSQEDTDFPILLWQSFFYLGFLYITCQKYKWIPLSLKEKLPYEDRAAR